MVNVLIVDELKMVRLTMKDILSSDPAVCVVGMTDNEQEALRMVRDLDPHLVVLGLHLQKKSGYDIAKKIMASSPRPIIMAAGSSENMDESAERASECGILDVVNKSDLYHWRTNPDAAWQFVRKVKLLSRILGGGRPTRPRKRPRPQRIQPSPSRDRQEARAVAIVSSTGGPNALDRVLSALPLDTASSILIVQHMSTGFIQGLAEWLDGRCPLDVHVARDGELLHPCLVLLAPDDSHLTVTGDGRVRLLDDPPVRGHRPSGEYLFRSVAEHFGPAGLGILLTGMGQDGAHGLKRLKDAGGRTIAQDEQSSVIFGMPKSAIDLEAADKILPLDRISTEIVRFSQQEPILSVARG